MRKILSQVVSDLRRRSSIVSVKMFRSLAVVFFIIVGFGGLLSACSSKAVDVREVLPGDALVYLEAKDLGAAVSAMTESNAFQQAARSVPDLSPLNEMEFGVAVTGFQTKEQAITAENSVLNFQPIFVAAVETRLWNFQAIGFVEQELGLFISEAYGGEAVLETSEKHDGRYFVWTAQDGRKAYALVINSLILFGNDESSLEKCLAVKRGEIDNIAKNPKITKSERLAFGYVSPDGIAQLSNIAGLSIAKNASDDSEVQSFVSRILPELLRGTLKDLTWTAQKSDDGIEDKFSIETTEEPGRVLNETIRSTGAKLEGVEPFLMRSFESVTRYDLNDPQIAWRSILLTTSKMTDPVAGQFIIAFAGSIFEPYAIENPELFLSAVSGRIVTARFDAEGEKQVVIADVKNLDDIKRSLAKELLTNKPPERLLDADVWRSEDGDVVLIFVDGKILLGDQASALGCLEAYRQKLDQSQAELLKRVNNSNAPAVTVGWETGVADQVAQVISDKKQENQSTRSTYMVETRFNPKGIERRTISSLGFLGLITSQFVSD